MGTIPPRESRVQREIGQIRPFSSVAQEAVVGLLRTASEVQGRFSALLEPHGLSFPQYNVLRILRGAGGALPTMHIGSRLIDRTPGITRLVDRLEARGLVVRTRTPEDRRVVVCSLTESGAELLSRLDAPVSELDEACMEALAVEDVVQLVGLLDRIRAGSGDVAGHPEGPDAPSETQEPLKGP